MTTTTTTTISIGKITLENLTAELLPAGLKQLLQQLVEAKLVFGQPPLLLRYLSPDSYRFDDIYDDDEDEDSRTLHLVKLSIVIKSDITKRSTEIELLLQTDYVEHYTEYSHNHYKITLGPHVVTTNLDDKTVDVVFEGESEGGFTGNVRIRSWAKNLHASEQYNCHLDKGQVTTTSGSFMVVPQFTDDTAAVDPNTVLQFFGATLSAQDANWQAYIDGTVVTPPV